MTTKRWLVAITPHTKIRVIHCIIIETLQSVGMTLILTKVMADIDNK